MREKAKALLKKVGIVAKNVQRKVTDHSAAVFAALADSSLLKWTESISASKGTAYDKAMDAGYIAGPTKGIGGGDHRLFDGGHDLLSAWDKVKEAKADDTFSQEVIGYVQGLWKDVTTPKGLPFDTLSKESFEKFAAQIGEWAPFIDRKYLSDLASFDAMEVVSSSLGAVSVLFCFKAEDKKRLSELLASMGVSSIASANPILGMVVVASTGYAYFVKKHEFDKVAVLKSGAMAAVSASLFAVLGFPFLIEVVLVMALSMLLRKTVMNNDQLIAEMKRHASALYAKSPEILEKIQAMRKKQAKVA